MPASSLPGFLETLIRELTVAIHDSGFQEVKVIRSETLSDSTAVGSGSEDLQWCCGKPDADSEGHLFLGASQETWEAIGGTSEALLGRCIEKTLTAYAGLKPLVAATGSSEAPLREWPRIALEMSHGDGAPLSLYFVLSPALEAAIDSVADSAVLQPSFLSGLQAADLLAQVHVPVSVSFGGTQIRMKDLMNLSTGSVVELDQGLSDAVEIRANNCLIARGEVVAVDGHYGVRVLELVSRPTSAAKEGRR
jgi:flagellar motor switch protein FliN/FliY